MKHYADVVQDQFGNAIANASVTVSVHGGGTPTLYSDDGITARANPVLTDALGRFDFYVADGRYDLAVSGAGFTPFTLVNVEIADLTEENVNDQTWLVQSGGFAIGVPGQALTFATTPTINRTVTFPDNTGAVGELNFAQTWTAQQTFNSPVLNGVVTGTALQGTDTKLLTSGAIAGVGTSLCTDANGGATTTGCSSGSVGPGTVNTLAKFTSNTAVGNSTCSDDGTNPTRCPSGMNSAVGGYYAEWVVDTGGVVANKLVCRSSQNKAQICGAGTTQGVLGVAQTTVSSGGTVLVCFAGKCSVISSNATTAGHWLIPSATIAGDVDDTGSFSKPTTAIQTIPAETSVSGGSAVLTTFLSPDTLNATGGNGITSVNTVATGPNVNIIGAGNTSVSTLLNTVTISGGTTGNIAGTWVNQGANYTFVDADNQLRYRLTGAGTAYTLPQPGTITVSPNVALRFAANAQGVTSFTSPAFTEVAGHQMIIFINEHDNKTISSITASSGSVCSQVASDVQTQSTFIWYCPNLVGGASVTYTVTFSGVTGGPTMIVGEELTGTTFDNALAVGTAGTFQNLSLTNPVHFSNAVSYVGQQNGTPAPPGSWTQLDTLGNANIGVFSYRLLANNNSIPVSTGSALSLSQAVLSISSHPSFVAGWYVTMENTSTSVETITPTSSTINGQSTFQLFPNQQCTFMSNGTNWDATCGFVSDEQTNGIVGGSVTIAATPQAAGTSSIAATTLFATPSSPVSTYMMTGYADVTVAGTSCAGNTTVVLNAIFTDPNTSSATTLALGTFTITTNGVVGTSNFSYPPAYFRAKGSTNIQFSTTFTAGGSCSPAPTVQVTPILQVI